MKLDNAELKKLQNIISTCALGGIDSAIIDSGSVRGINADRSCVIISDVNVPKIGEQKMGLTRLSSLRARLDLFADNSDSILDAKETDRGEISQLEISLKKNKAQFRCTATSMIKAPKSVNDSPLYMVSLSKDELKLVLDSIRVMGSKKIALIIKSTGETIFQSADSNNDNFVVSIEKQAELLANESDTVVFNYLVDVFTPLMKAAIAELSSLVVLVGVSGTITLVVNGHNMIILPQVGEEI